MHGSVMIFLAVVPLLTGAFGNYLVPLQIGASDMVFPRLNAASYWIYLAAGLLMLLAFFVTGGAAEFGLDVVSAARHAGDARAGLLAGGHLPAWRVGDAERINVIATVMQLRAPGLTFMRLPFFVWAQLVAALLLLLAFPSLQAAAVLQLMDRLAGTSFFLPTGLVVSGVPLQGLTGGGNPLLWQHLFWFLGHPEVYVLILPAIGIVAEIIANNTRRPLWGYRAMVGSVLFIGVMSMIVWAHHMFLTGMGTRARHVLPGHDDDHLDSVGGAGDVADAVAVGWLDPFHDADVVRARLSADVRHRRTFGPAARPRRERRHPARHVVRRRPLSFSRRAGNAVRDLRRHLLTGSPRSPDDRSSSPGRAALLGIVRHDDRRSFCRCSRSACAASTGGSTTRGCSTPTRRGRSAIQAHMTWAAVALGLCQLPFLINLVISWRRGAEAGDNPWEATTLEWQATRRRAHGNFLAAPEVHRGPYDYSLPGHTRDFVMQGDPA